MNVCVCVFAWFPSTQYHLLGQQIVERRIAQRVHQIDHLLGGFRAGVQLLFRFR